MLCLSQLLYVGYVVLKGALWLWVEHEQLLSTRLLDEVGYEPVDGHLVD